MWHSLSCPSTQGMNHGLPNCSTLCCTCKESCVTGGRHVCKNFVTPVRKISDQHTFIVYFSTPLPFFSAFLHPVFFPNSVFFWVVVLKMTSVSMFCTDNYSCIAIETYVDQMYSKLCYTSDSISYSIYYSNSNMNDGKHCIHK